MEGEELQVEVDNDGLQMEGGGGDGPQVEVEVQREEQMDDFLVRQYVVAICNNMQHIAMVEDEDPDEENDGYTFLKYMQRKGENCFIWGKVDLLKTKNSDILKKVSAPIPVSTRLLQGCQFGYFQPKYHEFGYFQTLWGFPK